MAPIQGFPYTQVRVPIDGSQSGSFESEPNSAHFLAQSQSSSTTPPVRKSILVGPDRGSEPFSLEVRPGYILFPPESVEELTGQSKGKHHDKSGHKGHGKHHGDSEGGDAQFQEHKHQESSESGQHHNSKSKSEDKASSKDDEHHQAHKGGNHRDSHPQAALAMPVEVIVEEPLTSKTFAGKLEQHHLAVMAPLLSSPILPSVVPVLSSSAASKHVAPHDEVLGLLPPPWLDSASKSHTPEILNNTSPLPIPLSSATASKEPAGAKAGSAAGSGGASSLGTPSQDSTDASVKLGPAQGSNATTAYSPDAASSSPRENTGGTQTPNPSTKTSPPPLDAHPAVATSAENQTAHTRTHTIAGMQDGTFAGVMVGVGLGLVALALLAFFLCCRRRRKRAKDAKGVQIRSVDDGEEGGASPGIREISAPIPQYLVHHGGDGRALSYLGPSYIPTSPPASAPARPVRMPYLRSSLTPFASERPAAHPAIQSTQPRNVQISSVGFPRGWTAVDLQGGPAGLRGARSELPNHKEVSNPESRTETTARPESAAPPPRSESPKQAEAKVPWPRCESPTQMEAGAPRTDSEPPKQAEQSAPQPRTELPTKAEAAASPLPSPTLPVRPAPACPKIVIHNASPQQEVFRGARSSESVGEVPAIKSSNDARPVTDATKTSDGSVPNADVASEPAPAPAPATPAQGQGHAPSGAESSVASSDSEKSQAPAPEQAAAPVVAAVAAPAPTRPAPGRGHGHKASVSTIASGESEETQVSSQDTLVGSSETHSRDVEVAHAKSVPSETHSREADGANAKLVSNAAARDVSTVSSAVAKVLPGWVTGRRSEAREEGEDQGKRRNGLEYKSTSRESQDGRKQSRSLLRRARTVSEHSEKSFHCAGLGTHHEGGRESYEAFIEERDQDAAAALRDATMGKASLEVPRIPTPAARLKDAPPPLPEIRNSFVIRPLTIKKTGRRASETPSPVPGHTFTFKRSTVGKGVGQGLPTKEEVDDQDDTRSIYSEDSLDDEAEDDYPARETRFGGARESVVVRYLTARRNACKRSDLVEA